jgi:hypothetical protein
MTFMSIPVSPPRCASSSAPPSKTSGITANARSGPECPSE